MWRAGAALGTLAVVLSVPGGPIAATPRESDPAAEAKRLSAEREKVRANRAQKAAKLDALTADQDEVSAALDDLQSNVTRQQELLLEAQRAVDEADRQATEADKRARAAKLELVTQRREITERAVNAYIYLPATRGGTAAQPGDATDMVSRQAYLDFVAGGDRQEVDRYRAIEQDLEAQLQMSRDAKARAQERRSEVSARLGKLQEAQAEQLGFQEAVAERIAATSAEARGLAAQDEKLSKELVKQQLALAEQLRKAEEERKRREQALFAAKVKAVKEAEAKANLRSSGGGGGGGSTAIVGSGEIVSVGGIRVHRSIAGNLQALLNAAAADGINFGGGGYRDSSDQIAVRRNNCGTSYYAIYQMPSSSCSPPTARPGASQHERGLAIDFQVGGSTLSRGSAGFQWLKANAAQYGFYNLPSEAWHWSTTGN